jgi:RimJ/RimL family protein N-acetyltransferase
MNLDEMLYTFYAKDGILIGVRHLRYDDAVYLVDIFENMSSDSRYQRFHQTTDHVHSGRIWREAEAIAHMDTKKQGGLIAFADLPDKPNAPVGAARYICLDERRADTAVSVRDDMQGKGIGTELLALLAEEARHNGLRQLVADVLNNNKGIVGVLKKLPYEMTRHSEGVYSTLVVHLDRLKEGKKRPETAVSRWPFLS